MTSEKALEVRFKIPEEMLKNIRNLIKADGGDSGDDGVARWLTNRAIQFVNRMTRTGSDLSPKEVMSDLGISKWTYRGLVNGGTFPGLYYVNPRVVRIPRKDVEAYKESRLRTLPEKKR